MKSIELDMIVTDSLDALKTYQSVFDVKVIHTTTYNRGLNEVIFSIHDFTIHLLDANPEYELHAPEESQVFPFWINVTVDDIQSTVRLALNNKFTEIQPITKMEEMGVSNAVLKDSFGYQWMLHEVHEEKTPEEIERIMESKFNL